MKPLLGHLIASGVLFISASTAFSQTSFTGAYSQNFDSMGTTTTAPTGWSIESEAGSHYTFAPADGPVVSGNPAPGTSPNFTAGALSLQSTLTAATPSTQKGTGGYNFLATAVTGVANDRALGTSPSGNAATIIELGLTNNSGSAISSLSLSYDIDRFTTTVPNNSVPSGDPYLGLEEFPGYQLFYSLDSGSTWTNVSGLNPTLAGPSGVVVPNSTGVTTVSNAQVSLSSSWNTGSTLELAWFDDNAESPSPDQLLGLNNVTVIPEPGSTAMLCLGGALLVAASLRRRLQARA